MNAEITQALAQGIASLAARVWLEGCPGSPRDYLESLTTQSLEPLLSERGRELIAIEVHAIFARAELHVEKGPSA